MLYCCNNLSNVLGSGGINNLTKETQQLVSQQKDLVKQIKSSLNKNPRDFLFTSPRNNKPYISNTFNRWVNRTFKKLTDKENISISTLRHIYITRRDLKLESSKNEP